MDLSHVEQELKTLCSFLHITAPELLLDVDVAERSIEDPRAFCQVDSENLAIYCAPGLANIPRRNRLGILLHELGHLFGSMDEVQADEWVLKTCPQAGLHYSKRISYYNPFIRKKQTAKNIQCVSRGFDKFIETRT